MTAVAIAATAATSVTAILCGAAVALSRASDRCPAASTPTCRPAVRGGPEAAYMAVAGDAVTQSNVSLLAAERELRARWHTDGTRISAGELIAWAAVRDVATARQIPVPAHEDPR